MHIGTLVSDDVAHCQPAGSGGKRAEVPLLREGITASTGHVPRARVSQGTLFNLDPRAEYKGANYLAPGSVTLVGVWK